MADDRPTISGHVPAAGAPLTSRTLALRPGAESLQQGDLTSSDAIANAVYSFLQGHPGLGVPEEGQENIAGFARGVNQATPWGSGEEALASARKGDFPSTVSNMLGVVPIIPGAKAAAVGEDVASTIAKRAAEFFAPRNMMEMPDIRGVPVEQAINTARNQPHLIPQPNGGFVGAPRSIQTMDDLQAARDNFDAYINGETRGWDWYNRYRTGENALTGGDPLSNQWMPKLQGVWSQGVDPQSEMGRVIKELVGAVTGSPQRAGFGAQHDSLMAAIAANDPGELQLGNKTGQYASLVNPVQGPPTATGVNDFRYANQWGFVPEEGVQTRDGDISVTGAQHRFLDYETALAVDRANQRALLGRTDWTGEQIQAMPWVRQKAEALIAANTKNPMSYEEAVAAANKTAPDFASGFRFNATFEPQPGEDIPGHLPNAADMTPDEGAQYARFVDPTTGFGSSMTDPETGRDILYGGQRAYGGPSGTEPTGVSPYVMPTQPTQGFYVNNAGLQETNPGFAAHPLVPFDVGPAIGKVAAEGPPQASGELPFAEREYDKVKGLSPSGEDMTRTAEYVRSVMNSQQSGGGNVSWVNPPAGVANGYVVPLNRPATVDELIAHQAVGAKYGLPNAVDNGDGSGITVTNFEGGQPTWTPKLRTQFVADMKAIEPADATAPGAWARTNSIYEPVDWTSPAGSGAVSQGMINRVTKNPQVEQSYATNPFLPPQVQANIARGQEFESATGPARPDIFNTQALMGEGPGWINQMRDILQGKAAIPATTAAGVSLFPAAGLAQPSDRQPPPAPIGSSSPYDDWWRQLQNQQFAGQAPQ